MTRPDSTVTALPRRTSRLSGFHKLSPQQRRELLVQSRWAQAKVVEPLAAASGFSEPVADAMIENVIGLHGLPLAVALNFRLNGEERLLPMAVEEPSIVAACSLAAKLAREGGGFTTEADPPIVAAQVELLEVPDLEGALHAIAGNAEHLLAEANRFIPAMKARGGGALEVEARVIAPDVLCVHLHVDCRDAMGANTVNAVAEGIAPLLARLTRGRAGLRILSNLTDRRKVYVRCSVPTESLRSAAFPDGEKVRDGIIAAQRFAELDPYRATTHNKGIMNGVDAVLVACGNDWRAVEAGAHAYAARSGTYRPLTRWFKQEDGALGGELVMPLATSTVGGAARTHPGVQAALQLAGSRSALDLAMLAGAAGLASNLAALRALSTEGIMRGHMSLHARRVAGEAGAEGEQLEHIARQLSAERVYRVERARELMQQQRQAGGAR